MMETTILRLLRLKYGIKLPPLAKTAGISHQSLSRLELAQVPATQYQEERIYEAIRQYVKKAEEFEAACRQYRGALLTTVEEDSHAL